MPEVLNNISGISKNTVTRALGALKEKRDPVAASQEHQNWFGGAAFSCKSSFKSALNWILDRLFGNNDTHHNNPSLSDKRSTARKEFANNFVTQLATTLKKYDTTQVNPPPIDIEVDGYTFKISEVNFYLHPVEGRQITSFKIAIANSNFPPYTIDQTGVDALVALHRTIRGQEHVLTENTPPLLPTRSTTTPFTVEVEGIIFSSNNPPPLNHHGRLEVAKELSKRLCEEITKKLDTSEQVKIRHKEETIVITRSGQQHSTHTHSGHTSKRYSNNNIYATTYTINSAEELKEIILAMLTSWLSKLS
jgi:hypothetical protein